MKRSGASFRAFWLAVAVVMVGELCFVAQNAAFGQGVHLDELKKRIQKEEEKWTEDMNYMKGKPGRYILLWEKEPDLCRAYKANLNSFPHHGPMPVERFVNPKFPEFTKPKWNHVDIKENMDLIKELFNISLSLVRSRREEFLNGLMDELAQGRYSFGWSNIDVNNDGIDERIYRMNKGIEIDSETGYATSSRFDFDSRKEYVRNIPYIPKDKIKDELHYACGLVNELRSADSLFYYKEQLYFDSFTYYSEVKFWKQGDGSLETFYPSLVVYKGRASGSYDMCVDTICVYQWVVDSGKEK